MGPIVSPEISVSNHLTTRNNPEDGRIQLNRGGSLPSPKKSRTFGTESDIKLVSDKNY